MIYMGGGKHTPLHCSLRYLPTRQEQVHQTTGCLKEKTPAKLPVILIKVSKQRHEQLKNLII